MTIPLTAMIIIKSKSILTATLAAQENRSADYLSILKVATQNPFPSHMYALRYSLHVFSLAESLIESQVQYLPSLIVQSQQCCSR